jgi:hypothetical protein
LSFLNANEISVWVIPCFCKSSHTF